MPAAKSLCFPVYLFSNMGRRSSVIGGSNWFISLDFNMMVRSVRPISSGSYHLWRQKVRTVFYKYLWFALKYLILLYELWKVLRKTNRMVVVPCCCDNSFRSYSDFKNRCLFSIFYQNSSLSLTPLQRYP